MHTMLMAVRFRKRMIPGSLTGLTAAVALTNSFLTDTSIFPNILIAAVVNFAILFFVQKLLLYDRNSEFVYPGDAVYVFRNGSKDANIWASGVITKMDANGACVEAEDPNKSGWYDLEKIAYIPTHDKANA